jgi:hypothetical protein
LVAHKVETLAGMTVIGNYDVLQKIAKAGLDRALEAAIGFDIVGDRALDADTTVRLSQYQTGSIGIAGARTL